MFYTVGVILFLDGPAQVIRHVSLQPEVEQVTPNEYRGFGIIEKVRRRPFEGS
jgi:hypothetical protein